MLRYLTLILTLLVFSNLLAKTPSKGEISLAQFEPFTGKIIGNKVRVRCKPALEAPIIAQLNKNSHVLITDDAGEFWAIAPLPNTKAYIFRSYIIDNVVEADRVNVRLEPNKDSPIIGRLQNGYKVDGKISETDHKWLEITPPQNVKFYIAKEYISNAGKKDLYAKMQKRKMEVEALLTSAFILTQEECKKNFDEMNPREAIVKFETIIKNYSDFPDALQQAKDGLALLQDNYLQKKIAYLEAKANLTEREKVKLNSNLTPLTNKQYTLPSSSNKENQTDKMKTWEHAEQILFQKWSSFHPEMTIDDYYNAQRVNSITLRGVIESFDNKIKNKPGNYIIRKSNNQKAFLYSTYVDLDKYIGKELTLSVSPRPNNNFAFPAYFVISIKGQSKK